MDVKDQTRKGWSRSGKRLTSSTISRRESPPWKTSCAISNIETCPPRWNDWSNCSEKDDFSNDRNSHKIEPMRVEATANSGWLIAFFSRKVANACTARAGFHFPHAALMFQAATLGCFIVLVTRSVGHQLVSTPAPGSSLHKQHPH